MGLEELRDVIDKVFSSVQYIMVGFRHVDLIIRSFRLDQIMEAL